MFVKNKATFSKALFLSMDELRDVMKSNFNVNLYTYD